MPHLEVREHHGTPTLFRDGQPIFAAIYMLRHTAGQIELDPDFAAMRAVGFHLYTLDVDASFDSCYDPVRQDFSGPGLATLDILREYAAQDPEAAFLLRVTVEPRGAHSAWIAQHPEECEVLEARAKGIYATTSFASELWLHDAQRFLQALVRYLDEHDLSRHIAGYLICGGDSSEWVKVGPMEDWAGDYSPPMQAAFRRWLRAKYADVEALRRAWGDAQVDFDQAVVPSPEEQSATDLFLFKDPQHRRRAIDYMQCFAETVARDITTLCAAAKAASRRKHLVGIFYGYLLEIIWNNGFFGQRLEDADAAHMAAPRSGHAALAKVLASPDVDFLSSPYSYGFRGVGGEGGFMAPDESVRRAGKLWISEEDMRTHRSRPDAYYGRTRNAQETNEVLKRQFANIFTHSAGGWWVQWAAGSWADPDVLPTFRRLLEIGQEHIQLADRSSAAEIAVVVDAENWFYRSTRNNFDIPNWRNRAWGIARLGAPVDFILLSDLLEGRAREYKLYYMWNTFHFSAADRARLQALLRRDRKVALWVYAPGFVADDLSVEHCSDITGIRLGMTPREWGANLFISNFDHPLTRVLPTSTFWGTDTRLGPLFTVDDPQAVTLGTVVTRQGRCEPGYVLREHADWASLYTAAPNPPPGVLKEAARYAGVHLYSESEDVLYADHGYVALHTVRTEVKTIRLPHVAEVWEVFTGRQVARACTSFQDEVKAGTTVIYRYV